MGSGRLTALALVALLALVLLVWAAGNFLMGDGSPGSDALQSSADLPAAEPPRPASPAPAPPPPPVPPEVATVPEAQPVEPPLPPEPAPPPLPPLNESDAFVEEQLAGMDNGSQLLRYLVDDEIVRRFVIFIDGVRTGDVPERELPFVRELGELSLREVGEDLYMMEVGSHARFDPLLDSLLSMDNTQALALYRRLYPLLQEAYAEIGYPRVDFTDTVLASIEQVLSAELPEGPFMLTRPSVMYLFADEEVENLSAVEKLLLRLGPDNVERLRERLRSLRDALQANRP